MNLLGIDIGSTMVKAALFDAAGTELAVSARKVEHVATQPGWDEVDMDTLWRDTSCVIRETIQAAAIQPESIAAITCTGHGNGLFMVDAEGRPVRAGIGAGDSRAMDYVERWDRELLDDLLPKVMQRLWPGQPNALLAWLKEHEPECMQQVRWMFMVKDFIRYRLTGQAAMEITDLTGTSLIDVGRGDYDRKILDAWGLADLETIMPPIVQSAEICGTVTPEAAEATGLAEGTPVAGGMFDIDACGLAVGMTDESTLCMVAGTWGNNQYISKTPVVSRDIFMTTRYSVPGYYLMLEGSATSASNLEWFVTNFFEADKKLLEAGLSPTTGRGSCEENRSDSHKEPLAVQGDKVGNVFDLCNQLVASTLNGGLADSGITFLPYLYGTPVSINAKACFFGLDGSHTRADLLRAIYEGVVFGHRWHVEQLLQFRQMPDAIRLTGGACKSEVWMQIFADILQTAIEVPAGSELGALGASICGSVAVGIHESYEAACQAMVRVDRRYEPNRELAAVYDTKYARFKQLVEMLQ